VLTERSYFVKDEIDSNVYFCRGTTFDPVTAEIVFKGECKCEKCGNTINPDLKFVIEDKDVYQKDATFYHLYCKN